MKRSRPIALLASVLLGFGLLSLIDRREPGGEPIAPARPAVPQAQMLGWEERLPEVGAALVFRVRSLEVTAAGWQAEVAVENLTGAKWVIDAGFATAFGLMLFPDDDLAEVERRNAKRSLPAVRHAREIVPLPPATLAPGTRWSGVLRAPGSLPAGRFVRVVFGPLTVEGEAPKGLPDETVVWITDHAHLLEG